MRDLAALNALPSLCVGRTPEEAIEIVLDALPNVLECDLVYLRWPDAEHGRLYGRAMEPAALAEVASATRHDADGSVAHLFLAGGALWCLEAEIPSGAERGCLIAGRAAPLDPETDRVLVRTAANVVGTLLATANELATARRKDDFLAMLGHELRNPLAPILTAVDLLPHEPQVERLRDVIERNTRHLIRIVDDLLDISRVTRGHVELRNEHVSLASVLERAIELAAPAMSRNQHDLRVEPAPDITLEGDPVRLAQVFGNLLTNAAKFTPPEGRIDVEIAHAPGRVRVTVRDNGFGVEPDQLARIFEPFVQADRERDAQRGGLGLGLAIVRNLVEHHGGTVAVASEGRGRGAAFTVELPTTTAPEAPVGTARLKSTHRRAGIRVLVVDDNIDLADMLSEALARAGFETFVAHDGQAAIATWRSRQPHAGVLDVGLPDLDGYQLARALRAEHGAAATLIAATGYGQPTDRVRASDAGFDCYLIKPVSVPDLLEILDERIAPDES